MPTVLSGMRPTGRLHLGDYAGALENWLQYQHQYDSYFMVADLHALTTDLDTRQIARNTRDMVIDWLACGLDPARSTLFMQSQVPEHAELHLLLSMSTPLPWLEGVPSYKEQQQQLEGRDLATYGFLGYPLLQSADIMIYKAAAVPVGEDQAPHVELTREVVRRFIEWSADGKRFAFENRGSDAIELWVGGAESGKVRRIPDVGLNPLLSSELAWMPDQRTLLVKQVPRRREPAPAKPVAPSGPVVKESQGRSASSTYEARDLLTGPDDEPLFEYYTTSQIALVDATSGTVAPVGEPGIFGSVESSPDGRLLLVERFHGPWSYTHAWYRFPRDVGSTRSCKGPEGFCSGGKKPLARDSAPRHGCRFILGPWALIRLDLGRHSFSPVLKHPSK